MDISERDRLAAAIIALRPDWACNGFDRLRTMRDWLSKNLMDWSFRDATVALTLVAIDPASNGPARLMTDGPWRTILRHVSSDSVTAKMPGYAQLEPECGYPGCGVRRDKHLAHVIPAEIPGHEWEQSREVTRSSSEFIARAKSAALSSKETERMSEPIVTGHDMSRFWRLVAIENGPITGTVWVTKPDKGEQRIRPVDLIIWDERRSGMMITDLTAYIRDGGVVEIPEYMIRGDARAEVLDQIEAVKVAMLAASNAITWPEDGADHE